MTVSGATASWAAWAAARAVGQGFNAFGSIPVILFGLDGLVNGGCHDGLANRLFDSWRGDRFQSLALSDCLAGLGTFETRGLTALS